ncbi:MAG: cation transporter [Phycisphaerales bacterium]|nr:MAG: cation transporter [Phycisphaerales bacterium]
MSESRRGERAKRRVRAVAVALLCSGVVGIVEVLIGVVYRLDSVLSEGIHTLADMLDSMVAFWAVRRAADPPDREHQFGHGKYESVAAMVEGLVIAGTGVWICGRSLSALISGRFEPNLDAFAITAMLVASVFYLVVSRWLMRESRQLRSPAVYAEAAHLRTHVVITGGLFGGLLAARMAGWMWMDAVLALGVGLILMRTAWNVTRPAWCQLTDASLAAKDVAAITDVLKDFSGEYIEIHDVRTRAAGVEWHVDFHLVVGPETTVHEAHELCDRLERAVAARFPEAVLTIHVEPQTLAAGRPLRSRQVYLKRGANGDVS